MLVGIMLDRVSGERSSLSPPSPSMEDGFSFGGAIQTRATVTAMTIACGDCHEVIEKGARSPAYLVSAEEDGQPSNAGDSASRLANYRED